MTLLASGTQITIIIVLFIAAVAVAIDAHRLRKRGKPR